MYGDLQHCTLLHVDVTCRPMSTCVHAECDDVRRRTQCKRGLRTTNDGTTSIQMIVLEIIIAVLHSLPNGRRVGHHV